MKKTFVQSSTAIGSFLMAIGASTCCIIPFTLFSMGVGGAWIGNLTAMSEYHSIFIFVGLGFLAAGLIGRSSNDPSSVVVRSVSHLFLNASTKRWSYWQVF